MTSSTDTHRRGRSPSENKQRTPHHNHRNTLWAPNKPRPLRQVLRPRPRVTLPLDEEPGRLHDRGVLLVLLQPHRLHALAPRQQPVLEGLPEEALVCVRVAAPPPVGVILARPRPTSVEGARGLADEGRVVALVA